MDLKINEVTPAAQTQATQQVQPADDTFKFTLQSAMEDKELMAKLEALMNDISTQGKLLSEHMDVRDMKRYRGLIKEFMNEVVNRSHKFSRENFLDRRGRHRVYGMVKLVDEKLDELAQVLVSGEKDHIDILNRVDEIRGLLLDIST
ncbi:MAG: YaaR family protein [Pseudobutyrivibrio sp.]|nr:YaaR family protein [Pseudobutyrivibrio sp.]